MNRSPLPTEFLPCTICGSHDIHLLQREYGGKTRFIVRCEYCHGQISPSKTIEEAVWKWHAAHAPWPS